MNTDLRQIKDKLAQDIGYDDYLQIDYLDLSEGEKAEIKLSILELVIPQLFTKQQVEEACRKTLEKAAENAKVKTSLDYSEEVPEVTGHRVDKASILDPKNITMPQI